MAKKAKKSKSRKTKRRKNPTRRCSVCRSTKHDRRRCRSKKKSKSKKTRRRRKNPGIANSLVDMGLSYSYTKPKRNPCVTCGCTCKDGKIVDTTRSSYQGLQLRRNPGWSFKKDRVVPHEQQLADLYQRPTSLRRWNPCGSDHKTTRNPDCWMCDDTGYKGNDLCYCPAGNARSGANRFNPSHLTHNYCSTDDRRNPDYLPGPDDSRVCDDCLGDDPDCACQNMPTCEEAGHCVCGFCPPKPFYGDGEGWV